MNVHLAGPADKPFAAMNEKLEATKRILSQGR